MIYRGIDTLEFGLDIQDYLIHFRNYLDLFKEFKERSQQEISPLIIQINGLSLTVEPTGAKFYAYRLKCKDFTILFAEKLILENPPIKVRLDSGFLWSYGWNKAYELFLMWFKVFESTIIGSRVSRVDVCADSDEVIFVPGDINCIVCRARGRKTHYVDDEYWEGRRFSGFTVGRGKPLLARIYNKTLEIRSTNKIWFTTLWRENGWDGTKDVWRVEFQLRRQVVKELGIHQMEDLIKKIDRLWVYLTNDWLKIKRLTGKNVSRCEIKSKWKIIQDANKLEMIPPLLRKKVKKGDLKRLLDQAAGILISIGAATNNYNLSDCIEILHTWEKTKLIYNGICFDAKVGERQSKYLNQD